MDIFSILVSHVTNDPNIQTAAMGLLVKVAVDFLKKQAVSLDANNTKTYKVPVQLMVVVCSALVSLGDMYMKSQLGAVDPSMLVNFLTVSLPVYLNAMGIHLFANHVTDKAAAKEKTKNV